MKMLEAKSLSKALIPSSILPNPSPGHLQSTRLALHVDDSESICSVFVASGCGVYNIQIQVLIDISTEESLVTKGKEGLLIPVQAQVVQSSLVDRCPHRSEIQSVVLAEEDGDNCLMMGTVDSYGHLIVSRLNVIGADFDRLSYSVPPRHCGIGESSWAGICFSPARWSMAAVAHSFSKSIDVYDQDIHLRSLRTFLLEHMKTGMGKMARMMLKFKRMLKRKPKRDEPPQRQGPSLRRCATEGTSSSAKRGR